VQKDDEAHDDLGLGTKQYWGLNNIMRDQSQRIAHS
jgi:hypothetical protein